jgi:5-methylcytosine-specific restriction enzyme subunit McrC
MRLVFQAFVRNFYRIEQDRFTVRPLQLNWDAKPETERAANLLPVMVTDIFLCADDRRIIVDTKYSASSLVEHHGKKSVRSENLYQLFAYLKNAEARGPEFHATEGMLLYPAVNDSLCASFNIQGHRVTVATVDLNQPWPQIRTELLSLIKD